MEKVSLDELLEDRKRLESMLDNFYYVFEAYDRIVSQNLDKEDRFHYSGLAFEVGQIGENLKLGKMPEFVYEDYESKIWSNLAKTRDKLFHGYEHINLDILYDIIENHLPNDVHFIEDVLNDVVSRIDAFS